MLKHVVLVSIIGWTFGQSCDFDGFHTCVKSNLPEKTDFEAKEHAFKSGVDKCLTDSGCQIQPTKERGGPSESDKCRKEIFDKIKHEVQQCVRAKFPNFKQSENRGDDHVDSSEENHRKIRRQAPNENNKNDRGHRGGSGFERLVDLSCKDDKAKASAKQCIAGLKKNDEKSAGNKPDFREVQRQVCQKRTECLKKLTPACQKQLAETKSEACRCIKEKKAQFETSLEKCHQPSPSGKVKGQRGGSFDRLVGQFCNQRDPCQEDQQKSHRP